jgi:glycosyltransferase involved in cell wall biosynthesis
MSSQDSPVRESPLLSERLHVLTLTPFYPVRGDDGQGCFVSEPLSWLARLGVASTVRVARPFYRGGGRADDSALPAEWVRFFSLPGGIGLSTAGAFLFARVLGGIRRLHASDPVHLIHAHAALPCGHAAWLLGRELKIPFVVTVHGLDAFSTRQVTGLAGKWCEQVSRSVYRAARSVICVSEHVRARVMEGAPGLAHATVVYNGADPAKFFPPEDEPQKAMILSVGNLIPIKGHELLLRAFASLQDEFPGATLEIIGDGPERSRLEKLARAEGIGGKVRFWGRQIRSQVAGAMRRATIFALPSRYEGLGCVYLEAMSTGRPVIACRGQGIEEVIQDGVNGCLVEPDDQPGLANTLAALLRQAGLRRKMGSAARETVMQGYTQAAQAARLLRLYGECRE